MASSTIVQPATARSLKVGGIISGPTINVYHEGETDGQQLYGFGHASANSGGWFDTLGSGGGGYGVVTNRHYTAISDFIAGRQFQQYGIVRSRVAPFRAYVKTSAGTQTLTADPSTDGANWTLLSATTGPSLFNNNELVDTQVNLYGANPATISWLGEGLGTAMTLTGRPANGSATSDAGLRVNGLVNCEALTISNTNHAGDPTIGTNTLVAGVATIVTAASDPLCRIFLTRTGVAPAPGAGKSGTLQVVSKTASQFVVNSLDDTGAVATNDVGTFDWFIVNPVW